MVKTCDALDATLKCKDRPEFYPCIADVGLDASDHTYHKFLAEKAFMIFMQKYGITAACVYNIYCKLSLMGVLKPP